MARVNLDDLFFSDKRIELLAKLLKEPSYTTRGRLVQLFHFCYNKRTFLVTKNEINIYMEWIEDDGMLDKLTQCNLAEVNRDGTIRLKGVEKRINYLFEMAEKGKRGGIKSAVMRKKAKQKVEQELKQKVKQKDGSRSSKSNPPSPSPTPNTTPNKELSNKTLSYSFGDRKTKDSCLSLFKAIWNEHCGVLPKCKNLNPAREKKILARIKENNLPIYWENVISNIAASNWCTGHNENGWIANIDFMLKPETHLKAAEGVYSNRKGKRSKTKSERIEEQFLKQTGRSEGVIDG